MAENREQDQAVRIAVLEERVSALRAEIASQAIEYQRRLAELNHAHDKQVADQATYVSQDRFAGWQGEINGWRNTVSKTLAELEGRTGGKNSVQDLMFKVLPLLVSAAVLVLLFLKR